MNYTVVINSCVWGGSLLYYAVDARKWFTGPKITIDTDDLTEEQAEAIRDEGLIVNGLEPVQGNGEEATMGAGRSLDKDEKNASVVS